MSTCDDGVDGERKQQSTPATMWQVPNGPYTPATIKGIPSKLPGQQETEKGRTEVSRACVDPTFEHKFWLECSFHLASNHHEPAPTISYSFHTKKPPDETKALSALIGLPLAPMFPFSAGNYLLGGEMSVTFRTFVIATIFGCLLSNLLSVSVGMGGSELFFPTTTTLDGVL
jgi:hypothetical protein